jgi:hypothetical protein
VYICVVVTYVRTLAGGMFNLLLNYVSYMLYYVLCIIMYYYVLYTAGIGMYVL